MLAIFVFAQQTKEAHIGWFIFEWWAYDWFSEGFFDFFFFFHYSSQYDFDIDTMIYPKNNKNHPKYTKHMAQHAHVFMTSHGLWVNFRTWKNSDSKRTYLLRSLAKSLLKFQLENEATQIISVDVIVFLSLVWRGTVYLEPGVHYIRPAYSNASKTLF